MFVIIISNSIYTAAKHFYQTQKVLGHISTRYQEDFPGKRENKNTFKFSVENIF